MIGRFGRPRWPIGGNHDLDDEVPKVLATDEYGREHVERMVLEIA